MLDELFNHEAQYYWCKLGAHYWHDLKAPKFDGWWNDVPKWVAENAYERYCGCLDDGEEA